MNLEANRAICEAKSVLSSANHLVAQLAGLCSQGAGNAVKLYRKAAAEGPHLLASMDLPLFIHLLIVSAHCTCFAWEPITNPRYLPCGAILKSDHSGMFLRNQACMKPIRSSQQGSHVGIRRHFLGFSCRLEMVLASSNTLKNNLRALKSERAALISSAQASTTPMVSGRGLLRNVTRTG